MRSFLEWDLSQFMTVIDHYDALEFGDGGGNKHKWLTACEQWTRSTAVWSMALHIVGLVDRLDEKVLINTTSKDCVHADFAILFHKPRKLCVPEAVPRGVGMARSRRVPWDQPLPRRWD